MLSTQAVSERDVRRRRVCEGITPEIEDNDKNVGPITDDSVTPLKGCRYQLRGRMLDQAGSGDIAEFSDETSDKEEDNTLVLAASYSSENIYETPKRSTAGNGKHSFEAIPPSVNVLLPVDILTNTFETIFICPLADCYSKTSQQRDPLLASS